MKRILSFLKTLDAEIAWQAANVLLVSIGLISLIGFIGTMHYYLYVPCALLLLFGWVLLYKLIEGFRMRRLLREAQWPR